MQEWSFRRVGLGLSLVMITLTLVRWGSISGTWNRSEALRSAIHQSSTARRSGGSMRSQSHGTDAREECWVWHC